MNATDRETGASVPSREEELESERAELLERVSSYRLSTIQDKVAWILNHHPDARNSDITLQLKYWATFQPEHYAGGWIDPENLYVLARLTSLKRARAKIQNEYRLFLADPKVRQRRGTLADEDSEWAVQDRAPDPLYSVYMDDSGKNDDYLIVGSVWLLSEYQAIPSKVRDLHQQFGREFHFANAGRKDVGNYKELADALTQYSSAMSFKYISVPSAGIRSDSAALTDLYCHLLTRGVQHEDNSGRAPLPRRLQAWIDSEGEGIDRLRQANLEERLKAVSISQLAGGLWVDQVRIVNSHGSWMVQVADLIAASVNRLLNRPSATRNHKDEIAEYVCDVLKIPVGADPNEKTGDISIHIEL